MKTATDLKVRIRNAGVFGKELPEEASQIFAIAAARAWPMMSFAVAAMPPTANHMYQQVSRERRVLSAETVTFRQMVNVAIGAKRHAWKPRGRLTMMVFFLQPYWLKKDLTVREADADNRIKPLQDAIEIVTGVPDETIWDLHTWKIVTQRDVKTLVWLFDRGDEVDVYA